jgi:imidazoleglycerol-phosphate dehydratase
VTLALDGSGQYQIETGIGFLDHMLAQLALHGLFDLTVLAEGDLHVDAHHTVEDVALVLGQAFDQILGDRSGIARVGSATVPMDEALASVTVDLSGRPYTVFEAEWTGSQVGELPLALIGHFFQSFAVSSRANVHARVLYGKDDHHRAEALFKGLARALDGATRLDPRRERMVPSTKGTLGDAQPPDEGRT